MTLDFAALLTLLTLGSGIVWGVDALLFARARRDGRRSPPALVEYARSLFPVFFIVLALRSFIVEPFRIPSASMMPTLLRGDFILVNKFTYGIRLPVLNSRIIAGAAPQRGDIIVFRYPENPAIPYIKRVVGVPGDRVQYRDSTLTVNGKEATLKTLGVYHSDGVGKKHNGSYHLQEQLGETRHDILVSPTPARRLEVDSTIPAGHYFVLGDNRDNSRDSRYWGLVPDENLVGKAFYIWMNWSGDGVLAPSTWDIDWGRIGSAVQ